jgi:hypothetical protein
MNTPFIAERKILSNYLEVSRTFTYNILLTVPAFLTYDIGIFLLNLRNEEAWHLNGMHGMMEKVFSHFGLPTQTSFVFLVVLMTFLYRYEQARKEVNIHPFFFVKTFTEALFLSAGASAILLLIVRTGMYYPEELWGQTIQRQPLFPTIVHSCGDGFYEGIAIASIINLLLLNTPKSRGWHMADLVVSVAFSAVIFGLIHDPRLLGFPNVSFGTAELLFKIGLGAVGGAIYVTRGFATMVWTHIFFNFWLLAVFL